MTIKLISHRRNTLSELKATPTRYGVEVDVRSYASELVIHHDPYVLGENFEDWIDAYDHGTLILNVKEEGLEARLIEILKGKGIEDYFFLDQSFPFLVKWSGLGESRAAVRISEFESVHTALALAGRIDWVWIDCFTKFPIGRADTLRLRAAGFRLCAVSPELQGRNAEPEIALMMQFLDQQGIEVDAVCTKRPDLWELCQRSP